MDRARLVALEQVGAAAARVVDPVVLARIALDETIKILRADRAFLFLVEGERLVPHLGRGGDGGELTELSGYSASLVERVRQSRVPLVVTGTEHGAALGAQSVVLHGLRSIMVAPLLLEGRLLGVVYLDSQVAKGIFTADDVGLLTALTNHIATSLETSRAAQLEISVQMAQRQRDLADGLRSAQEDMAAVTEPREVLARLVAWAPRLVGCQGVWVFLEGSEAGVVVLEPDGAGGLTEWITDREPGLDALLGVDAATEGASSRVPAALREQLAEASWIAVPLRREGRVLAVLVLSSTDRSVNLAGQVDVAAALVAQAMTAHDRAELFAQVQALAVADELTGIANRRHFFEVAQRDVAAAVRARRPVVALMVDIDHFKAVNDTYGHPTGDDVIRVVAQRLSSAIRTTDVIGRYGGEEFALLLLDSDVADDLPERLRRCVADVAVETRSGPLAVTVSIGLAELAADDDLPALLARADQGLYRAKRDGRNLVRTAA